MDGAGDRAGGRAAVCEGPDCANELEPYVGVGRPSSFCSDACKQAAYRWRRHVGAAADVADLIRSAPTMHIVAALAGLSEPDLERVRVIVASAPSQGLISNSSTTPALRNDTGVIVTPPGHRGRRR